MRHNIQVQHKATGETALAQIAPSGCLLVQFDRFTHPQSHGWHLYPRHHFVRRKKFGYYNTEAKGYLNRFPLPTGTIALRGLGKTLKGSEGKKCNRTACQSNAPALWFNHGSRSWYCESCSILIGQDPVNWADWNNNFRHKTGHPMFETREMMEKRT